VGWEEGICERRKHVVSFAEALRRHPRQNVEQLADPFPDSKSANDALRALLAVATRALRRKRT
jgi:hypothetical protein